MAGRTRNRQRVSDDADAAGRGRATEPVDSGRTVFDPRKIRQLIAGLAGLAGWEAGRRATGLPTNSETGASQQVRVP